MNKINIDNTIVNDYNIDSYLFLEYINAYGFDPNNYNHILELFQSPKKSISQFLKDYKQYLLSMDVNYRDLDDIKINGAYGYLNEGGIVIPKMIGPESSNLWNDKKIPYDQHDCDYPVIETFDVIIANGNPAFFYKTVVFNHDKYLGFCMDADAEQVEKWFKIYEILVDYMNERSIYNYTLEHDKVSEIGKEFCLIRKKNKY